MSQAGSSKAMKRGKTNKAKGSKDKSGPSGDDYDQVFQLAVNLEEQGERYQFGPKAKRNYEHSIQNYQLSIQLLRNSPDPGYADLFNSHYNLARVLVHLGTTFGSARSECVGLVKEGIERYREAVELAAQNSHPSDLIDATYNLGLGLSSLAEMLSAGARPADGESVDPDRASIALWEQAKGELQKAYELQKHTLLLSKGDGSPQMPVDLGVEESAGDSNQSHQSGADDDQAMLVEEVFVLTPSVVIDTLFDIFETLLFLYPSEPTTTRTELVHFTQELQSINRLIEASEPNFSRRFEMDNLLCNVDLTIVEHELSESAGNELSILEAEQQLANIHQRLAALSMQYSTDEMCRSDFFNSVGLANNYTTLSSNYRVMLTRKHATTAAAPATQIQELITLVSLAMSYHSEILSRLRESRLRPIKQVKPFEVPVFVASSLTGQSELQLIIDLTQHFERNALINSNPASFVLALEAYNESCGPFFVTQHPGTVLKLQFTNRPASDQRHEWAYFSARLEAIKSVLRSKWHILTLGSSENVSAEIVRCKLLPLAKKFEVNWTDVRRFSDDCEFDPVWQMTGGGEQMMWKTLLAELGS